MKKPFNNKQTPAEQQALLSKMIRQHHAMDMADGMAPLVVVALFVIAAIACYLLP